MTATASSQLTTGRGLPAPQRLQLRSEPLYDALAHDYDAHFEVPHRKLYDRLAWERTLALLPPPGPDAGPVVDAGCGVGRWARLLIDRGYDVIGIEQAPGMLDELRRRPLGERMTVLEGSMDVVDPACVAGVNSDGTAERTASLVLAMGSLQYTDDPEQTVCRLVEWLRPGGALTVLVDSLVGLVLELTANGRQDEAMERLETRRGLWKVDGLAADLHLMDAARLVTAFEAAGLVEVEARGLLVTASAWGRTTLGERLAAGFDEVLALERRFGDEPQLADIGKQLLVTGRRRAADPSTARDGRPMR